MSGRSKKVKVWIRTRPTSNFAHDMIHLLPDEKTINLHSKRDALQGVVNNQISDWSFKMDGILHNSNQDVVYDTVARDVVTAAVDGYNGTIMAYGQTGAGKTFTITGATENYRHRGIIPRAIQQIFREVEEKQDSSTVIRISYLEIYNEVMYDLLAMMPHSYNANQAGTSMAIVEDSSGVYVKGLSCHLAQNEEDALNILFEGETNRAIAAHSLNQQSSRSHCIFTLHIESRSRVQSEARYTVSKLNLVDLAGSERIGKTKSEGKTQQEAMYINKSLSFLEQTVIALADRRRDHIPYRQTKLTHYLKDSIGGNCRTILVANIWGEGAQIEETISTLRFATRMMCVTSEPAVNEHYDPTIMVKHLEKEIHLLRHELAMHDTLNNRGNVSYEPLAEHQKYELTQQVRRYLEGNLDELDIVNLRQIKGIFESFREIHQQMELEVEDRIRTKYTLTEQQQDDNVSVSQKGGAMSEDGEGVGETDRQSFGIGSAPKSNKADPSAAVTAKKRDLKKKSKERASPTGWRKAASAASQRGADKTQQDSSPHTPSGGNAEKQDRDVTTPVSSVGEKTPQRPNTPPPRSQAFDEFKDEKGSEINRILNENKDILVAKKKMYRDLASLINATKTEIDESRMKLEQMKNEREMNGLILNDQGEIVITEDEFEEITRLKGLKSQYKLHFDELRFIKNEVHYCQKLVDQCRQRLIHEFDTWYTESYLDSSGEVQSSAGAGYGARSGTQLPTSMAEDEAEKFERLHNSLLMENPGSAGFYNARMRTDRRKTYEMAMGQRQPQKPGTPVMRVRNKPPTMLQMEMA